MVSLENVPVVEVNKDNLSQLWPGITLAIQSATFIAIDTELSGLGNRKLLNAKIMDERYHHMCEVARTRSIVAFGISCFKHLPQDDSESDLSTAEGEVTGGNERRQAKKVHFQVQTYNIILLCSENYTVEAHSLKFLVDHGFDFNLQYSKGVPYHRGQDKDKDDETIHGIRDLFTQIVLSKAPLILHNAVIDLVFLYHSFFTALPTSQQTFVSDLAVMFPAGIFDTKYVTDFKARLDASYLEYVFKRCQRGNMESGSRGWSHIEVCYPEYSQVDCIVNMPCSMSIGKYNHIKKDMICEQYQHHGWCPDSSTCTKSHDIDIILDVEDQPRHGKKASADGSGDAMDHSGSDEESDQMEVQVSGDGSAPRLPSNAANGDIANQNGPSASVNKAGSHRAGFDAFMTGYIFAFYCARYGSRDAPVEEGSQKGTEMGMEEYKNKMYLVGKDIPLQITSSSFARPSKGFRTKMAKIKTQQKD